MTKVLEFVPSKKYGGGAAKKTNPPAKRRKKPVDSTLKRLAALDKNSKTPDRTFELTSRYTLSEYTESLKVRLRVRKGGPETQVFKVGVKNPADYYFGELSEYDSKTKKWSPYTWGHIAMEAISYVRELDSPTPVAELSDEADKKLGF